MTRIIDFAAPVLQKARKGAWNDLDIMEVGQGGMNFDEYGAFSNVVGCGDVRVLKVGGL